MPHRLKPSLDELLRTAKPALRTVSLQPLVKNATSIMFRPKYTARCGNRHLKPEAMMRTSGPGVLSGCIVSLVAVAMLAHPGHAEDQGVKIRYREGSVAGFVVLRNEKGAILASGEFSQVPRGDRIKSRLVLHFRDGSLDDEISVYSQKSTFHLITDHHVQRGPSVSRPCRREY